MSIQLVLYPQNYEGRYSSLSTPVFNQYVADNVNFTTLLNNAGYDSTANDVGLDAINNSPAINAWKRFRSVGGQFVSVTMPSRSNANKLELYSASGNSSSGVYQLINGLSIGSVYDLSINITQAGAGGFLVIGTSGNITGNTSTLGDQTLFTSLATSNTGTQTVSFTADATEEILLLTYQNDGATIHINNISIQESAQQPTLIFSDLQDGQVICDLYEEEDIPLSLSIDDFKNVAEKTQSYSKDFNLPATKRNNKIFTHLFDVNLDVKANSFLFNPYLKTQCILKQDGYDIFKGYLRLNDITNKEGEISYNVNLYSNPVALKDILENKTFRDLDFSELNHLYNKTNIKQSWYDSTGITLINPLSITSNAYDASLNDPTMHTTVLKYPFVNWVGDLNSDLDNNPKLETLEDAFRPFINCKYILDSIFDDTPFTYTSNFLNTTAFTNLFMDFNWGAGNAPTTSSQTGFGGYYSDSASNYAPNGSYGNLEISNIPLFAFQLTQLGYDFTTNKFTATTNNFQYDINYNYEILINNVTQNPLYSARWLLTRTSGVTEEIDLFPIQSVLTNQIITFSGTLSVILNAGDTLEAQFYSSSTSANSIVQNFDSISNPPTSTLTVTGSILNMTAEALLESLRGDLGQWEYLKSFIAMFNLVIIKDKNNPSNLIIETYNDIFLPNATSGISLANRNIIHDWTDKIDITEIKLSPLDLLNKTIFKYENDEDDYSLKYYKSILGRDYGYEKHLGFNNDLSITQGEKEISASPFSATFVKPLQDHLMNFIVPVIFSLNGESTESFDNSPRILYKVSASPTTLTGGATYYIPAQNGTSSENSDKYLRFSHTSGVLSTATDLDLNFGQNQLLCGATPINNLYQTYYSKYYNELYNPNTKFMNIKVNLNASDINGFEFNDNVIIKNTKYRVNKIEYKPNDLSTVEFILIG
tara:strand:- start:528 stop:3326 length:2799 start_codon:yes stop_codon:yes gene_type:complete